MADTINPKYIDLVDRFRLLEVARHSQLCEATYQKTHGSDATTAITVYQTGPHGELLLIADPLHAKQIERFIDENVYALREDPPQPPPAKNQPQKITLIKTAALFVGLGSLLVAIVAALPAPAPPAPICPKEALG